MTLETTNYSPYKTCDGSLRPNISDSGRMRYIDALRGFSMFLVVFGHVLFQSIGIPDGESYLNMILASFRMPMFFFVSGFVAYKPLSQWTWKYTGNILLRKFQAQIVGTIFFYTMLLLALHADDPFRGFRLNVGGYWFTITLFRVFLIYAALCVFLKRLSGKLVAIFLIFISFAGLFLYYDTSVPNPLISLIGYNTLYFFQFFVCGLMLRRYGVEILDRIIKGNTLALFSIGFAVVSILCYSYLEEINSISPQLYYFLSAEVVRYFGLVLVFGLFYKNRFKFEIDNRVNRIMQLIGRRTLDIYFLHYFFLPDLPFLKPYVLGVQNAVVTQLLIGVIIAAVVTAICLGISYILRLSPILRQWLFGMKKHSPQTIRIAG